jgi:hypothetical protein
MVGMLGAVYALMGKMDQAKKIEMELKSPPINNDKQFALTTVLSNMGKIDEAFKILNHLVDEKYGIMIYMKVEKKYLGVENDPRYFALLRRMGF